MPITVILERRDPHGSKDGEPTLQVVRTKELAEDVIRFAAQCPEGVHVWWYRTETEAYEAYRTMKEYREQQTGGNPE